MKFTWFTAEKTNKTSFFASSESAGGNTLDRTSATEKVDMTGKDSGVKVSGTTDTLDAKAELSVAEVPDTAAVEAV